jgi:hypothetical protein
MLLLSLLLSVQIFFVTPGLAVTTLRHALIAFALFHPLVRFPCWSHPATLEDIALSTKDHGLGYQISRVLLACMSCIRAT